MIEWRGTILSCLPRERAAGLIFGNPGFKEIFLFAQINRLAHPRERIFGTEFCIQSDAFQTSIRDVLDVFAK